MKMPLFSISGLMLVVAAAAVEVCAWQLLTVRPIVSPPDLADLVIFGMLPMVHVLALGLLPFLKRGGRARGRPALVGFEVFGLVGLVLFFVSSLLATQPIHDGVGNALRSLSLRPGGPVFLTLAVLLLILPQLALATLGAWLGGRYEVRVRVEVSRRTIAGPGPDSEEFGAIDPPMGLGRLEVG